MPELYFKGIPDRAPAQFVKLTRSACPAVTATIKPFKLARIALAGGLTNAFSFNWQNPESVAIIVIQCAVNVTTAGGAGATIDIGPATGTGVLGSALIDGQALDGVTPYWLNSFTNQAGTGLTCGYLNAAGGATDWVTGRILIADSANLAGYCYLFYMLLA